MTLKEEISQADRANWLIRQNEKEAEAESQRRQVENLRIAEIQHRLGLWGRDVEDWTDEEIAAYRAEAKTW